MNIKIVGPIDDASGYANTTREIALALYNLGAEISIQRVSWGATVVDLSPQARYIIDSLKSRTLVPDCILNIGIPPHFRVEAGVPSVGLTMLEVDGLPATWARLCNRTTEVWVPSTFNVDTFSSSGVKREKLRVMPLGVNSRLFCPDGPTLDVPGRRKFMFLSVAEWVPRKGFDLLIEAFVREFREVRDVCLAIKAHSNGPDYDPGGARIKAQIQDILERVSAGRAPPVLLIPQVIPPGDMPALYRSANCFVLPTRGEGWNLPALEALSCGLPVITTSWSGHLDFLDEGNSFLIRVDGLEPVPRHALRNAGVYAGYRWACPSLEHLQYLMRWVYEHQAEAAGRARRARPALERNLTWEACARRIEARLEELINQTRRPPAPAPAPARAVAKDLKVVMIVPSWGRHCGVAEYSAALAEALESAGCGVRIVDGPSPEPGRALSRHEFSVVHIQHEYSLYSRRDLELCWTRSAVNHVPAVLTLHSFTRDARADNYFLGKAFRDIIVHSERTRQALQAGGWKQRIHVLPMGVRAHDLVPREAVVADLGLGNGPAIGFVGFMHWYKGLLPLVTAVARLRATHPEAICHVFSGFSEDRSSREYYEHFISECDAAGIRDAFRLHMGYEDERKLVQYLHAMDLNVLPYEANGYYATSAAVRLLLAAQRPIITTDAPFFADLDREVLKIAEPTPDSILDAITFLLAHPMIQRRLVDQIRRHLEKNSWDAVAARHIEVYRTIVGERT